MTPNELAYELLMVLLKGERDIPPVSAFPEFKNLIYRHLHTIQKHLVPTVSIETVYKQAYQAMRLQQESHRNVGKLLKDSKKLS